MFLGLDSSTQSLTAVLIDPEAGKILRTESVNFGAEFPGYDSPSGFLPEGPDGMVHANPLMWLDALDLLFSRLAEKLDLSSIEGIAVSGQQHGSVYFDGSLDERLAGLDASASLAEQLAPALSRPTAPIWMDHSTTEECSEIAASLGGQAEVCRISGSVATERFTGPQIRKFFKTDPGAYAATSRIHLVSSFIGSVLAGRSIAIDHGDGAGMNLMNLESLAWDGDLLEATAPDLGEKLPPLAPSATVAGEIAPYFVKSHGLPENCRLVLSTGDNPSSLVGMGATTPGKIVVSLGTSDTMFAAMSRPLTDPNGFGHVFGNPAGGFMSLICFRNGSLARETLRDQLGLDWSAFDLPGLAATPPGNDGNIMLPFFGPETTPRIGTGGPVRRGTPDFEAGENPPAQVRALLEGQFLNMLLHSQWMELEISELRLTGGASRNEGIAQLAADVFQAPVERLAIADSAALGSALRAAHACGAELATLHAAFCAPDPRRRLEPDPATAPIYNSLISNFAELLSNQRRPPRNPEPHEQ